MCVDRQARVEELKTTQPFRRQDHAADAAVLHQNVRSRSERATGKTDSEQKRRIAARRSMLPGATHASAGPPTRRVEDAPSVRRSALRPFTDQIEEGLSWLDESGMMLAF